MGAPPPEPPIFFRGGCASPDPLLRIYKVRIYKVGNIHFPKSGQCGNIIFCRTAGKTEPILPPGCPKDFLPLSIGRFTGRVPSRRRRLQVMFGGPKAIRQRPDFHSQRLHVLGVANDRLLDLTEEIADEDSFAALRLLQTCDISKFGHA